ncbi:helix-turn-helix transcriptional regulator [Streptomyces sp. NPDC058701]|uniref:helix-turn-helix transcriptional regulator n=1 Tax=Streptomyces sp. NPDC058701 TaxID=3346608 RepID=UPI003646A73D
MTPAAAFVRNREGRYVWVNHAYAHLYGTTREAVIGHHVRDVDGALDASRFVALDAQVLAGGKAIRHTLTFQRADGSAGQAVGFRFPTRWEGEVCVAGVYIDITVYVDVLDHRGRIEADLRALRDHSGLACLRLSCDAVVREASPAAAELIGVRVSELVGRPAVSVLATDTVHTRLERAWADVVGGRRRSAGADALLVTADGRVQRTRLRITAVGTGPQAVWVVANRLGGPRNPDVHLTPTQERILVMLASGTSNAGIAQALGVSRQTVDYHLGRLRTALGASTRTALVARAYALGILSPDTWPPRANSAHV